MTLQHHDDLTVLPGDDWSIPFALLDGNGNVLDLTGAAAEWVLINPDGSTSTITGTINITAPTNQGHGTITVPRAQTITLLNNIGRYFDSLRITIGTRTTVFVGNLLVGASAFAT